MAGKYSDEHITPGAYVDELVVFGPETEIHYNSSNQIVKILKKTVVGSVYERQITDPNITDYVVDRVVIYSHFKKTL